MAPQPYTHGKPRVHFPTIEVQIGEGLALCVTAVLRWLMGGFHPIGVDMGAENHSRVVGDHEIYSVFCLYYHLHHILRNMFIRI